MQILKNLSVMGLHGKPILIDIFYENDGLPKPVVIFSHGFKGFKDWGHFDYMAKMFATEGFIFVKFNFAFNGTTPEKLNEFADLDAFGNNNLTKELDDLGVVIDFVLTNNALENEIDTTKLFLLGHSRGGGITIVKAAEDARVKAIVTLAAVGEFGWFWTENQIKNWRETGKVTVENSRTRQKMPLFYQYYENYVANKERLSIQNAVSRLQIPFLAIHGTDDSVVPVITSALQYPKWNDQVKVLIIDHGDHTFGVKQPFKDEDLPIQAAQVVKASIDFFKKAG